MAAAGTDTPVPAAARRERSGWYLYDWANSAFQTTVITVLLAPFLTRENGDRHVAGVAYQACGEDWRAPHLVR